VKITTSPKIFLFWATFYATTHYITQETLITSHHETTGSVKLIIFQ